MHNHNKDTHVLVDEKGNTLPTSGTREEMEKEALGLVELGHGPLELVAIGHETAWKWEMIDWGDGEGYEED
jgi:hypothetical protein